MLLPEKMYKVIVIMPKDYTERFLFEIQRAGIAQVEDIHKFIKEVSPGGPLEYFREISSYELTLSRIIDTFEKYVRKPSGIKELIKPHPPKKFKTKRKNLNEIIKECQEYVPKILAEVERLDQEIKELADSIESTKNLIGVIEEIPFEDIDLRYVRVGDFSVAVIARLNNFETFKEYAEKHSIAYVIKSVKRGKETVYYGLILAERKSWNLLLDDIPPGVLSIIQIPEDAKGAKKEYLDTLKEKINSLREKIKEKRSEIVRLYQEHEEKLKILYDEVRNEKARRLVPSRSGESLYTRVLAFWVPERFIEKFKDTVERVTEGKAVIGMEEAEVGEDAPILLKNPKWAQPFEFLTRLFSLPKYGKIDPTIIIGPIFAIYYGIMLGDFLYGFLVFLLGILLMRGMGKYKRNIYDFGFLMATSGFTSMIVGAIQGGYFGDTFQRFLGINVPMLYDPFSDPMKLLMLSLYIGLFQLNLGMILSSYQLLREGHVKEFICDRVSWFILQPAGAVLILNYLFGREFSPLVMNLAYVGVIVGLLLIFIEHKGLGFFEITGFIGEWLSYTRILALDLATSGTAMTINIIVGLLVSATPFLIPIALLIWLGGHLINAVLQNLGSFVHSLRLQYVEFFGKFYESGGVEFKPFSEIREYTIVEGEE
ncbi:MAG: V-type ATP synthase subunit I [Euryarchaeota archaeon]|nr:V-type ATP synthase subunit I [Euryarchaeota archaeon]